MHSKLGNSLVSLGMQEYFSGVRLRHSANYPAVFGISLRFGQGVINSWLCTYFPYNLWQLCCSKTSCTKWRGAATSLLLPCTPSLKASRLKIVSGRWCLGWKSLSNLSLIPNISWGWETVWCWFGLPLTKVSWTFESVLLHLVHSGIT